MSALPAVGADLAPEESSRLAELEAVVERGLATFVDVGTALMEIRAARLYRETHATFESYLDERWDLSRSRGYRLIDAAHVAELVSPMGDIANERQARELVPLLRDDDEAAVVEVYRELRAEHGEAVTAKVVRSAVVKRLARRERDERLAAERATREAKARSEIEAQRARGVEAFELHIADVRTWNPGPVDAIITDPPYVTEDAVELHSALADFALRTLKPGGALVAMTWGQLLADVVGAMARPELVFRSPIAYVYENKERTPDRNARVFDGWKPVLVYHREAMPEDAPYFGDVISSPAPAKEHHPWGQSPEGFERLVTSFSRPGDLICDPFLGGGTTAVAALANARCFVGADIDACAVTTSRARLVDQELAA